MYIVASVTVARTPLGVQCAREPPTTFPRMGFDWVGVSFAVFLIVGDSRSRLASVWISTRGRSSPSRRGKPQKRENVELRLAHPLFSAA